MARPASDSESGPAPEPAKPDSRIEFNDEFSTGPKRLRKKVILVATPKEVTANFLADTMAGEDGWDIGVPIDRSRLLSIVDSGTVDLAIIDEEWMDDDLILRMIEAGGQQHTTRFCVILSGASEMEALSWMKRGAAAFFHEPLDEVAGDTILFVIKSVFRTLQLTAQELPRLEFRNPAGRWIEMDAPSTPGALEQFQRFFAMMHSTSLTDEEKRMLHLAINEIGMNAIEWGNQSDRSRQVRISYAFYPDKFMIRIEDQGVGFTPEEVPDPTKNPGEVMRQRKAAGKRLGGYGLALVRNIMDNITYNARGNIVYMEKNLQRSGRMRSITARLVQSGFEVEPPDPEDALPADESGDER